MPMRPTVAHMIAEDWGTLPWAVGIHVIMHVCIISRIAMAMLVHGFIAIPMTLTRTRIRCVGREVLALCMRIVHMTKSIITCDGMPIPIPMPMPVIVTVTMTVIVTMAMTMAVTVAVTMTVTVTVTVARIMCIVLIMAGRALPLVMHMLHVMLDVPIILFHLNC
mmetsp:Transcript_110466/g.191434  ORF Transcript_110466/g.191434 Transcript_110466/m.191434 type:complete len:164 (+) Transcript_110466:721-1212(+)